MSAFVNDRDALIQATVPRYAPATDRVLLLSATAQAFKVPATGVASPAAITFTAALINMTGLVDIVTSDGSVLELDGNTATLAYAAMASSTTTVTASIVVDGLTYTASQTVSKVVDGITGNSSRVAYSTTTLATLASTPATISSEGDASFPPDNAWGAGTRWDGSPQEFAAGESLYRSDGTFNPASGTTTWVAPYLNALKVGQLSAISADLGTITAGTLRAVTIHGGAGYPTPSYAWPTNGGMGYHLSELGLRMGNIALGKYFEVNAAGELYAPGLSIATGGAIFSGALAGATGTFSGTLTAASIIAGRGQNASGSTFIDFNAVGDQAFLYAGAGAMRINADGSGVFERGILSPPNIVITGVATIAPGEVGWVAGEFRPFTVYIDTGKTFQDPWNSAPSDTYLANATISLGSSSDGGCSGYGEATVVVGDGLTVGSGHTPVDNRIYIRFTWTPVSGAGRFTPTTVTWKLVQV